MFDQNSALIAFASLVIVFTSPAQVICVGEPNIDYLVHNATASRGTADPSPGDTYLHLQCGSIVDAFTGDETGHIQMVKDEYRWLGHYAIAFAKPIRVTSAFVRRAVSKDEISSIVVFDIGKGERTIIAGNLLTSYRFLPSEGSVPSVIREEFIVIPRIITPMAYAGVKLAWAEELELRGEEVKQARHPRLIMTAEVISDGTILFNSPHESAIALEHIAKGATMHVRNRSQKPEAIGLVEAYWSHWWFADGRIGWTPTYNRMLYESPHLEATFLGTFEFDAEAVCLDEHADQQNYDKRPAGSMFDYWYKVKTPSGIVGWIYGQYIALSWDCGASASTEQAEP